VVLTKPVCDFAGEELPSNFCLFCGGIFKRVVVHMENVHKKEKRIHDVYLEDDQATRHKIFNQLIREGNFQKNNAKAMTSGRGYILPTRKHPFFTDPSILIHCSLCYCLIRKINHLRHQLTCPSKLDGQPKIPLADVKLQQFNM
jgi:hypothetical protein